jgi:hypothetical protein
MHTIDYINKLRSAKFNDDQITAIAEILTDIEEKQKHETANKGDIRESELRLQKEIEILKHDTLKFVVWTGVGVVIALSGIIITGLKLLSKGLL